MKSRTKTIVHAADTTADIPMISPRVKPASPLYRPNAPVLISAVDQSKIIVVTCIVWVIVGAGYHARGIPNASTFSGNEGVGEEKWVLAAREVVVIAALKSEELFSERQFKVCSVNEGGCHCKEERASGVDLHARGKRSRRWGKE